MAKRNNILLSRELRLTVTPELIEDLEQLVRSARGRYGKNAAEAAERLLAESMNAVVEKGLLLPHPDVQKP